MEEVLRLFNLGESFRHIEKITGINRKCASRYIQSLGYKVTKRGTTGSHRKIEINEEAFKNFRTSKQAYWLGFLYADASVDDKLWILEVTQKDKEQVVRFLEFMKSSAHIGIRNINLNGRSYTAYRVSLCSKKLCKSLIDLGCVPRKSLVKTFPKLRKELYTPFIAGYFDGNGGIAKRKGTNQNYYGYITTGSRAFALALRDYFASNITEKQKSYAYRVYVPTTAIPKLKKYSHKIQSKICPLQE